MTKVFWSWQSDQPARETRNLIKDALSSALERIAVELDEAERPELDHDTQGVAGSPDIVATIFAKIENAGVFVADVTPIAVSPNGKHLPNPNVLIELGYAKRALTPERIILVWNTALTSTRAEDLPFDLRHRRGPISYSLKPGSPTGELRTVRNDLSVALERAIRACLSTIKSPPAVLPQWKTAHKDTPSIWQDAENPLPINLSYDGPINLSTEGLPRGYARLLPAEIELDPDFSSKMKNSSPHLTPLGRCSGLNWGATRSGFVSYRTSETIHASGVTPSATRFFRDTGEIWGVDSAFFAARDETTYFSYAYAAECWIDWIGNCIRVSKSLGAAGPFHLRLGVDGLLGTQWPTQSRAFHRAAIAIEDQVEVDFVIDSDDDNLIKEVVHTVISDCAVAFGLPRMSSEQFERALR